MTKNVAERELVGGRPDQRIRLEIGHPERRADGRWCCEFRILDDTQNLAVEAATGTDSLQAIVSALAGLRWLYEQVVLAGKIDAKTSWCADEIGTGIPSYLPQGLGEEFDRRLRTLVEDEVRGRVRHLEVEEARLRVSRKKGTRT